MIRNTKTSEEAWKKTPKTKLQKIASKYITWLKYRNYSPQTIKLRRYYLGYFLAWCSEQEIKIPQQITLSHLEKYQKHLANSPSTRSKSGILSPQSRQQYLKHLKVFINWLEKKNYLKQNPVKEIKIEKAAKSLPRNIPDNSQIEMIINQTDPNKRLGIRDRAILEVFYSTGIRASELIRLCVSDIDCEAETLTVREGKGRKGRMVPIGTRACHWVKKYTKEVRPQLCENGETILFLTQQKKPFSEAMGIIKCVRKYLKKAKIETRGSCHIFRHAMSIQMIRNGASTRYIQEILGHSRISTTQIYTKVTVEDLKRVHTQYHPAERDDYE